MSNYPGTKSGHGSFQNIINEIPPIDRIIIPFAGNCPIGHFFAGKIQTVINDRDLAVINNYWISKKSMARVDILNYDYRQLLKSKNYLPGSNSLIYADPPYLGETRKSKRPMYNYEMMDNESHIELLNILKSYPGKVVISGYYSSLYNHHLKQWRMKSWNVRTRGGNATECIWMNYPQSDELFTYDYLGDNKTERQRIKRKLHRWKSKLSTLDPREKNAIINYLQSRQ